MMQPVRSKPSTSKKIFRPRAISKIGSTASLVNRRLATFASAAILLILLGCDSFGLRPEPQTTSAGNNGSSTPLVFSTSAPLPTKAVSTLTPFPPASDTPLPTVTQGTAMVTAAPQAANWWEVYFTDPSRGTDPNRWTGSTAERLANYIQQAQKSIDIAAYEFDLTPIAEALIAAHARGVDVRWITDDEYGLEADQEADRGQFALLQNAGIPVKSDSRAALMHDKFIIFDGSVVWTGSTNITVNDHFLNNNNVMVIRSPELAAIYARQFAELWAGKFGPDAPSNPSGQRLAVQRTPVQVLFSPEDETISHLIPLVQAARESIRFMAFSFTHDALKQAMLERAAAGVDVRGIFETRGSQTPFSALGPLFCARLPVRQDGNPRTFHHKVIIIDERILITGSLNLSDNADEQNNENTLIITSRTISERFLKEFERRWTEAKTPNPAVFNCP